MFSEGQRDHMAWLKTLDPKDKCWCGWYRFGECPNPPHGCRAGKTNQDKLDGIKERKLW